MHKIKTYIAVLATAALALVALPTLAQSYAPASIGSHTANSFNPATGVSITPTSFVQILGFNGDLTNSLSPSATGTNYVVNPAVGPLQYIAESTNVNLAHATNRAAGTAWNVRLLIKGDTADHTLTFPAGWNWPTNAFDTNHIIGRISTIQSNTFLRVDIQAVGTNVLATSQTLRP